MKKYKPFILTGLIILIDQIVKAIVVAKIPENTIQGIYLWGFLKIWHVRNDAVAFSLGSGLDIWLKYLLFIIVPLLFMVFLVYLIVGEKYDLEFTPFQRVLLCGVVGGGCGNLIDRIFRHLRVVDFISTRMYGAFGMEWFPTYNIADASVVICVILLFLTFLLERKDEKK